jgi:hypothetical protein
MSKNKFLIKPEEIQNCIQKIRGRKVIIDSDLARFYGVETRRLNEQVKRNKQRFPTDFLFQLTDQEVEILMSQYAISSSHGGRRKTTYAFTEHGTLMAANVLRSRKAYRTSVLVIRAFIALRDTGKQQRQLLDKILAQLEKHGSKLGQHDEEISGIVKFLNEIMKMQRAEKKFLN